MIKIHIPTNQYEFVEAECETLIEAKILSDEIKKTFSGEKIEGMTKNEWSQFQQKFLIENSYEMEDLDKMSPLQKWWLHSLENALAAIKRKQQ